MYCARSQCLTTGFKRPLDLDSIINLGEFADEGDGVGYFESPDFFGEMGKEREW